MTTWAVIATGESLKPDPEAAVARVRHLPCVAVNDAFRIAPWARALVFCDSSWLLKNPAARAFAGEKWCGNRTEGVARLPARPGIFTNTNSGLLALHFAVVERRATRVLLLGVDMKGSHYFGSHPRGLTNTDPDAFAKFIRQFEDYAQRLPAGVEVINCNPESALEVFPKATLDEVLTEGVMA